MWKICASAVLVLFCAAPALAQNMPVRIYGPILSVEGRTVTMTNLSDGHTMAFDLAPQGRIVSNQPLDVRTILTVRSRIERSSQIFQLAI